MIVSGQATFTVGDNKPLGIGVNRIPASSFSPTATVTIYNSAGSAVVNAAICTVVTGAPAEVTYQWAPTIADTYTADFAVTDGGNTTVHQVSVIVKPGFPITG